jgi:3-oxoacyl-[acyl-carrier-protein] synthase II
MDKYIVIKSIGSVSALGNNTATILSSLKENTCHFQLMTVHGTKYPVIPVHTEAELELKELLHQFPKYKRADRTAQLAILAAEKCLSAVEHATEVEWTINAGSSRGATGTWENYHKEFILEQTVPIKSSPLTTLGNISTHVAQHQKLQGFQVDHSITCSSGLQALANAFAWLRSGLSDHFLAIGTEAPLTDFTIAQMAALGIYTTAKDPFPCKPCAATDHPTNTFVLGEAAVSVALVNKETPVNGDIFIAGMGTASETITNPTAISPGGDAFKLSMLKAMKSAGIKPTEIDLVIPHSPGTYQGDKAEWNAIHSVFEKHLPQVINHKFLTGHTLGASGLLSIELAYFLLTENITLDFPYTSLYPSNDANIQPKTVLVNSMGFGGNAVSIVLRKFEI